MLSSFRKFYLNFQIRISFMMSICHSMAPEPSTQTSSPILCPGPPRMGLP